MCASCTGSRVLYHCAVKAVNCISVACNPDYLPLYLLHYCDCISCCNIEPGNRDASRIECSQNCIDCCSSDCCDTCSCYYCGHCCYIDGLFSSDEKIVSQTKLNILKVHTACIQTYICSVN